MSKSAWVECSPECPHCGIVLTDLAWITWGGVNTQNAHYGPIYRIGDRVLWFLDEDGRPIDHDEVVGSRSVNYGQPTRHRVTVFEGRERCGRDTCDSCGATVGLLAVEIVGNRIQGTCWVTGVPQEWQERVWYRVDDADTGELIDFDFYW